jgi:hypothetical protein
VTCSRDDKIVHIALNANHLLTHIDRCSLVFTREMVDVVVVGNIDRYSLVFTREMVDVVNDLYYQPQQHQPFLW